MKKFKFLAFTLITVLTCVGFASCSDDDKDEPSAFDNSSWQVISSDDDSFSVGTTMTFKSNGNVSFSAGGWSYAKWTKNGDNLTIVLGEDEPDDKVVGVFAQKGENATYVYHWADADGKWDNVDDTHTMTLKRR